MKSGRLSLPSIETTSMTRLETLLPELAAMLELAPVAKLRAACVAACDYAVTEAKIQHPLVMEVVKKMREGTVITQDQRRQLEAIVARLDEDYFDMAKAFDEGRASAATYRRLFSQARAVACILFALEENPFHAATEAIYEAAAVPEGENSSELVSAIKAALM
jgi:hypothetical protein